MIELSNEERQVCQIWTRVMGYHRPVEYFNIGKKAEHAERKFFRQPKEYPCSPLNSPSN